MSATTASEAREMKKLERAAEETREPEEIPRAANERPDKAEVSVSYRETEGYPYLSRRGMMIGAGCRVGEAETAHPKSGASGLPAAAGRGATRPGTGTSTHEPPRAVVELLSTAAVLHAGGHLADDLCLLAARSSRDDGIERCRCERSRESLGLRAPLVVERHARRAAGEHAADRIARRVAYEQERGHPA